jgi:hypothetical protein
MLLLHMQIRRYFNKIYDNYLLLRDDFRIGLVISPRVAALAWGQYRYFSDIDVVFFTLAEFMIL